MEHPEPSGGRRYTWTDVRRWSDDKRWELIGGEAFDMSPAPSTRHQMICHELDRQLGNWFRGKPCRVFPAPTDVKLSESDVVQPDLMVVCRPERITSGHIEGPPDLVIEIVSPSTQYHDRVRKLDLYARSGVGEVWIVTPYPPCVEVFVLRGDAYLRAAGCGNQGALTSPTFPGLSVELPPVFDFPVDPDEEAMVVREGRPEHADR